MVKFINLVIICIVILCGCNNSVTVEGEISNTKDFTKKTNNQLNDIESHKRKVDENIRKDKINSIISFVQTQDFVKYEIDIYDFSTEGGLIEAYYYNSNLKYFITWIYGEMGKRKIEYYLIDTDKIFIKESIWNYKEPFDTGNVDINLNEYYIEGEDIFTTNEDYTTFNKIEADTIIEGFYDFRGIIEKNIK